MRSLGLFGVCSFSLLCASTSAWAVVPTVSGQLNTVYELTYAHEAGGKLCSARDYEERGGTVQDNALRSGYSCVNDICTSSDEFKTIDHSEYQVFYIGRLGSCSAKNVAVERLEKKEIVKGQIEFPETFLKSLGVRLADVSRLGDVLNTGDTQYGDMRETSSSVVNGVKTYNAVIYYERSVGTDVISVAGKNVMVNYGTQQGFSNSIYGTQSKGPRVVVPESLKKQTPRHNRSDSNNQNSYPKIPVVKFPTGSAQ